MLNRLDDLVFHTGSQDSITGTFLQDGSVIMTEKLIRHLPIYDDSALVGVVSIGDLVKTVIAEQDALINQLEAYVSGSA
jgi:CBS domain-containing protein